VGGEICQGGILLFNCYEKLFTQGYHIRYPFGQFRPRIDFPRRQVFNENSFENDFIEVLPYNPDNESAG